MANWEKLNKEFDDCLDSMTKEDWDNWYKNVEQKRINQNKMTAVEWLQEKYKQQGVIFNLQFEQAKEMEKENIVNAWDNSTHSGDYRTGKEYYEETFKSE